MEKLLFRASRAGMLMTEPRNKSEKEAGNLSETSKNSKKYHNKSCNCEDSSDAIVFYRTHAK